MFVAQRLKDVQRIKGLTMDTVLLQFWLAGLTGLAESNTSNQRLLWKCLVLVKVLQVLAVTLPGFLGYLKKTIMFNKHVSCVVMRSRYQAFCQNSAAVMKR